MWTGQRAVGTAAPTSTPQQAQRPGRPENPLSRPDGSLRAQLRGQELLPLAAPPGEPSLPTPVWGWRSTGAPRHHVRPCSPIGHWFLSRRLNMPPKACLENTSKN